VTSPVNLSAWPAGSRLILRKERPHPGAQLTFTDIDGLRITAFLTDTPAVMVPGQLAGLELWHRQHVRVEDRIRQAKAFGLRNLPCCAQAEIAAWLETILTAPIWSAGASCSASPTTPSRTRNHVHATTAGPSPCPPLPLGTTPADQHQPALKRRSA